VLRDVACDATYGTEEHHSAIGIVTAIRGGRDAVSRASASLNRSPTRQPPFLGVWSCPTDPLDEVLDTFVVEEITEKGKALMAGVEGASSKDDQAKAAAVKQAAAGKITRKIDTKTIAARLPAAFDNEKYWQKVAAKCVSCGICTFLCPTCYCFDINDEMLKGDGARYRNWDSCSFPLYTKMPAENPREAKWRRVRQKVNHKYSFYPILFGEIACTGCGRCIRLCPVNWDITQTLNGVPAPQPVTEKK